MNSSNCWKILNAVSSSMHSLNMCPALQLSTAREPSAWQKSWKSRRQKGDLCTLPARPDAGFNWQGEQQRGCRESTEVVPSTTPKAAQVLIPRLEQKPLWAPHSRCLCRLHKMPKALAPVLLSGQAGLLKGRYKSPPPGPVQSPAGDAGTAAAAAAALSAGWPPSPAAP